MKVRPAPDGWPSPRQVGGLVLDRGLVAGAIGVGVASVLAIRPWSVVYSVDIERSTFDPARLVVKCIREPHHDGPAQGTNDARHLGLELETMKRARARQIAMPRPYGLITELGAIVMERIAGDRLMSLRLLERRLVPVLRQTGSACRRWNSIDADIADASTIGIDDVVADVRRHADLLAAEGLGPATMSTFDRDLDAVIPTTDPELVATHGDLHTGNVMVDGDSDPVFIDSTVVRAPAISDVARLSASIRTGRWSLIGGAIIRPRIEQMIDALLAGYGDHDRHLYSLLELAATLEHWCDLRDDLSAGDRKWPQRRVVPLVDSRFTAELERWRHRVASLSVVRST